MSVVAVTLTVGDVFLEMVAIYKHRLASRLKIDESLIRVEVETNQDGQIRPKVTLLDGARLAVAPSVRNQFDDESAAEWIRMAPELSMRLEGVRSRRNEKTPQPVEASQAAGDGELRADASEG
jgi:hypothetical protein